MSSPLVLYYAPGSCALAAHIALEQSGLPYELNRVIFGEKRTTERNEDYYSVNPGGAVPALRMENGEILTEGPVIMQYIADKAPSSDLAPPNGSLGRYRLMEKLNFITSEIHKSFAPFFQNKPEEVKQAAAEVIKRKMALIAKPLEKHPFLLGDKFTLPDGYLYVMLRWADLFAIELPTFKEYKQRVEALPFVHAVLRQEGLIQ